MDKLAAYLMLADKRRRDRTCYAFGCVNSWIDVDMKAFDHERVDELDDPSKLDAPAMILGQDYANKEEALRYWMHGLSCPRFA